ncbi:hypothetical protein I8751_28965 [Nostocaceae cyanobacterium CENA357]|uniref:Uncharacterized protein n=1 Tax=Atlanticothrix silvestris CENA357 TaxID=1725252 RepID=A0A8J7L5X0_9CYAN|nr:hypothetical protein [Atlanticothrix silvestris]MBH8556286.1 hypothetical protein [Atlanticothrix silvestris CENA357]
METMKLRSHIGDDGILQIQTPTDFKDTSVEVVLVVQPLPDISTARQEQPQYNAWGKATTKTSISNAIARMQQLRREVALEKTTIRLMIEEGRRF